MMKMTELNPFSRMRPRVKKGPMMKNYPLRMELNRLKRMKMHRPYGPIDPWHLMDNMQVPT
jgi:hypothetical protein